MSDQQELDEKAAREARERERMEFWSSITIPVNEDWQKDGTNFANPVEVADMFARATGLSSQLAAQAEALTEEIANFEFERDEADIELTKLRRRVLADHFNGIKASWSGDVVEAYILGSAGSETERMTKLEDQKEEATRQIRLRKPSLIRLEKRLKSLEKHMDWSKQWLDFDKLMQRITEAGRRKF
jgi:hypothetical protein